MIPELWKIYCDSFPMEERRRQRGQMTIEKNPQYQIEPILFENKTIGLICYWDFKAFCFVEHFAIEASHRGSGHGKDFLSRFIQTRNKPIILEVEPAGVDEPSDSVRNKRILFYKALGFTLTGFDYLQPPYEKNQLPIPLEWMSYGLAAPTQASEHQLNDHSAVFAHWKTIVFSAVYQIRAKK